MSPRIAKAALVTAAVLLPAAPALAAEHSATVGAEAPTASWSGGPGIGVFAAGPAPSQLRCGPIDYCDSTLVKVTELGDLTLHAKAQDSGTQAGSTVNDLDVYAYASDAQGTQGETLGSSTSSSNDETIVDFGQDTGYVLFVVNYALGAGSYDGDVLWTPTPPPEEGGV